MKQSLIIVLAAFLLTTAVSGAITRKKLNIFQHEVPETMTLAQETMEFVYDYKWCADTTGVLEDTFDSDKMLLQIGSGGLSKFSSFKNLTVDSIIANASEEQLIAAVQSGTMDNGEFMTIFKNYPEGKLTHTEKICMDWFSYEEEMPELEWELTDSVVNILGYECRSAVCNFRGREWTAFYTEDIPLMEGPWKLHGLPGLIMKASDEDENYAFECVGIKSKANRPITKYKVPYNVTTRANYYDAKHRYDINPYAYFEDGGHGHVTVTDEYGNPQFDAYDPVELQYDYIERDWRE